MPHIIYYLLGYAVALIVIVKAVAFGGKSDNVTDLLMEDDTTRFYNE